MLPTWLSDTGATLMAVVNLNADSFSDPRATVDLDERVSTARAAAADGATIIDLGAQSAALDAVVVGVAEQVAVLEPVVARLATDGIAVSVDTYEAEVARAVLDAGAVLVNDFSGRSDPAVVDATIAGGGWYVLTHNPVGPRRRQTDPDYYDDVIDDVCRFFEVQLAALERRGLPSGRVVLDPGVDVGKTPAQTLELLRGRQRVRERFDQPQLWAISRKDVLGALTGRPPAARDAATLALLGAVADQPRTLARVHDVAAAHDVLRVHRALAGEDELPRDRLLDDDLRRQVWES